MATADGDQPIANLAVGDLVYGFDERSGTTGLFTVTAVLVHADPLLVHLTLDNERIETTQEHPFFVAGRGWVAAGDLQVGDAVRRQDGTSGTVTAVQVETRTRLMYNLTIATAHTFFVGDGGWLVHNTCPGDRLPSYGTKGRVTSGVLDTGSRLIDLESGANGPGMSLPSNTPGMSGAMPTRSHVEGHAAAIMRNEGIMDADLYINRIPCAGDYGCMSNLSHMLPEGATLRVHIREKLNDPWTTIPFRGLPDSDWPPSGLNPKILSP